MNLVKYFLMKIQHIYALIGLFLMFSYACQNSNQQEKSDKKTGESYQLQAKINNFPAKQEAYLLHIYGEDLLIVDTLQSNIDGKFIFNFSQKESIGMYRFLIDNEKYIDFIFNDENIVLNADYQNIDESLTIEKSLETKLYYEYRNQAMESEYIKAQASKMLMQINDEKDAQHKVALATFNEAQAAYQKVVQQILKQHSETYIGKIVACSQIPNTNPLWTDTKRNAILQQAMLENFNFSDTSLLHSSTIAKSIVNYLSLYVAENMSVAEQEKAFMQASDILLNKAKKGDNEVYAFVLEYLLSSFSKLEADKVLEHIAENYDLQNGCSNVEKSRFIQDKLANIKLFRIGNQLPNIQLFDEKETETDLTKTVTKPTLLIFWASWCEHCTEILPQIKALYETQGSNKKWEVVAVSLDEDKTIWQEFIEGGNYTWFNSCDGKSWEGESVKSLHIYATPVMLWLDNELVIKDLPKNVEDIKRYITTL